MECGASAPSTAGTPRTRAILNLERIGRVGVIRATVGLAPIPPMTPSATVSPARLCGALFLRLKVGSLLGFIAHHHDHDH